MTNQILLTAGRLNERHIKMGTLGKAYGSYGAYILASAHIISFLAFLKALERY